MKNNTASLFGFNLGVIKGERSLQEFKKLYEQTEKFVRKLAYCHLQNEQVDDIVQETYLKAWKNFNSFREESSYKTWIYRIAMNVIHDEFRKKRKFENYDEHKFDPVEVDFLNSDLIFKALAKLKESERDLFILYFYFSYTFEEIAKMLSTSESTVKSRVYKGKETFLIFLKENGVDNG